MPYLLKQPPSEKKPSQKTFLQIGEFLGSRAHISLIDYTAEKISYHESVSPAECLAFINKPTITWINVCGDHKSQNIGYLGQKLGFHPLMLEDIMHRGQRSKLDDYKEALFLVLRSLKYCAATEKIKDEQVSFVLGDSYVISFIENGPEIFEPVLQQLKADNSRLRQRGADFLCYSLVDCIVDLYFVVLEQVNEQLDNLEDELIKNPTPDTLKRIQHKKREISSLRKSVWPLRELINKFQRIDTPLIKQTTKLYVQDIHDHTIKAIENIDCFRDISNGLLEMYMSTMSQKMNEVMKVLTIVSTIFVPLTFIASIYGMNFKNMPELEWNEGYYIVLSVIFLVASSMLLYFKMKKWI